MKIHVCHIERKDDFITGNSILDRLRVGAEPTRARLQKHVLLLVFGERKQNNWQQC